MKVDTLALKGLLRFDDVVSLDFRELPAGVIAITGANGEGKTTLLESAIACLHRKLPSRDGELVSYATGRDSFIDETFSIDGVGSYRARLNLDGQRRLTDAVLEQIHADGSRTALNDGKVTSYDAQVRALFPSLDVLLASAFSAQNKRGNFIAASQKERKALLAELLGMERYEAMSHTARQAAALVDVAKGQLSAVRMALAHEASDAVVDALDAREYDLRADAAAAQDRRADLQETIAGLEASLVSVQDQVAAYDAATQRAGTLDRELASRRSDRAGVIQQIGKALLTRQAEQRRIETRRAELDLSLANRLAANADLLAQATEIRAAVTGLVTTDARLVDVRTLLAAAHDAVAQVMQEDGKFAGTEAMLTEASHTLARARRSAEVIEHVPCGGAGEFAGCQFLTDAARAKGQIAALETAAAQLPAVEAQRKACATRYRAIHATITDHQTEIRRLEGRRAAFAKLAAYVEPLAAAEARMAELTAARQQTAEDAAQQQAEAQARHDTRVAELEQQDRQLDTTITGLLRDLLQARRDVAATEGGHAQALGLQADLAAARARWDDVTATLARIDAGRQDLDRRRAELAAQRTRLAEIDARLEGLTTELLEWQTLTKVLGRDGLPALEIDAAGPTFSAHANTLLTACYGPRFSIDVVTQLVKADGKGMKDSCEVLVYDNERGGDPRDIADLSGGEQVVVSEALMNAIAIYSNERSPMPTRTCWRDETTGALDDSNAVRYLQMLRQSHALGSFHHTLFITHNPEIAAGADAQIRVANGTATIVYPPYAEAA
jgi:exonuclease SbcC